MPRIPISADPSAALQGLNQIKRKMEELGQTGKKVSDIDLSMPGLGDAAQHAKTINQNFEELLRVHKALASGIRNTGQQGVPVYDLDFDKLYPSSRDKAARAREQVAAHVTRGTPYYVAAGGGSGGGESGGGGIGGFVSGAAKYFKPMLALAGIGAVGAMANRSLGYAQDESMGMDTLRRSVNGLNTDFITFRDRVRESSDGLLVSYREMVKLTQSYTKASAEFDGGNGVRTAVGFGRSFGIDPGASSRLFGQAKFLGGQHTTPKQMAALFADAIAGSGMFSKSDEMMSYVVRFMDSQARSMGGPANIGAYVSQLAGMNVYGAENGLPGLKGSAGASLLDRMNQSIQRGGAKGDASRNYIWRAMGGGRGGMGAFEASFKMQEGMFSNVGGKTILQLLMDQLTNDPLYKGNIFKMSLAGQSLTGISAPNMKGFIEAYQKYGSNGFNLATRYKESHNLKNMSPTGFMGLARVLYAGKNGAASLEDLKAQYLGEGSSISDADKKRIRGAGDNLRDVIADIAAKTDMPNTPGLQTLGAIKHLESAMTASGGALLAPTNAIKEATAGTLVGVNLIVGAIVKGQKVNPMFEHKVSPLPDPESASMAELLGGKSKKNTLEVIIKNEKGRTLGTKDIVGGSGSISVPFPEVGH